jgi:hypothetical protein
VFRVCEYTHVPPFFSPLATASRCSLFFLNSPPLCRWFTPRGLRWFCVSRATAATRTATGRTSSLHAPMDTLPPALAKFSFHSLLAHTSSESLSIPPSSLARSLPLLLPVCPLSAFDTPCHLKPSLSLSQCDETYTYSCILNS